jgi:hypothetical protein
MTDHTLMKLGRKAVKRDSRTLALAPYLLSSLAPAPPARDWTGGQTEWGMMLNDQLGCCTIAGVAHAVQVWTRNAGSEVTLADVDIRSYYSAWDGYVVGNEATDNGGIELDVLTEWRNLGLSGHKLIGFADPAYSNLEEVRQAINLFGGVYIGLGLPLSAQTQDVWDVAVHSFPTSQKGSWGGHAVFVPAYDEEGFTCITWGALKRMTTAFWVNYCDEAHALFGQDWINTGGQAPSGFDVDQLTADLAEIH